MSDAPGRAGSAAAAGAPSRRAWPTAAAAEVGAGSGALPRGAAPAGCWAARAGLAKITRSTAFRVAWGMLHGDPVRPTNFGPPFCFARPSQPPALSRAPRRSAAARRRAAGEGRPSVTPCPSGRRSGRGASPGGPHSARSAREPPISPPPPPSEPGGPAPSTPAAKKCRRNGCRYAARPFPVGARASFSCTEHRAVGFRSMPSPETPVRPLPPRRPGIADPGRDLRRQGQCPRRLRSGTSAVTAGRPELSLEPVGTAGTAQHPAAIRKAFCDAALGPPARPEPG